jgi:diguanylate cyclase (GGDEF)-like protein/PAS domain S-box-containing protein
MHQLRTAIRLALCVGLIASAAVWVSLALRILENPASNDAKHRTTVAKYVSLVASSMINSNRKTDLKSALTQLIESEPALVSIGIREKFGRLIAAGPHETTWPAQATSVSANSNTRAETEDSEADLGANHVRVDLLANGRKYGSIELAFKTDVTSLWAMFFGFPVPLATFIGGFVSVCSWVIFERSFKYLDPSQVVPERVRAALDTMAEGVVLLDNDNEIGHANDAFFRIVEMDADRLLGKSICDFEWSQSSDFGSNDLPWIQALKEQQPVCGVVVRLMLEDAPTRKFIVNATPIVSGKGECRGVLVSLEDVTVMENKKHELSQMISTLRRSRDEVERQNVQLNFLASYDQLTECINRRVFFQRLESVWADESINELSVIMLDIDHFKSVNDNHGHGKGDQVLKEVGRLLRETVGKRGVVARLGGEEFAAILPHITLGPATLVAEEVRSAIRDVPIGGLDITISLGVSGKEMLPMDTQHLLDQADQALYAAKNGGRDQVVRYDQCNEQSVMSADDQVSEEEPVAQDLVAQGCQSPAGQSPSGTLPNERGGDQADEIAMEVQELVQLSSAHTNPASEGNESPQNFEQSKLDDVLG